jgi:carbamoyltransferase
MYILGINGGVRIGYRDASAVLLQDGQIVAAIEEERLNRTKGSPSQLPEMAIHQVLKIAGISMQDVAVVATHGSTWGEQYLAVLKNFLKTNFGHAPDIMRFHHHDCHAAGAFFASGFENAAILTVDNSGDGISTQISKGTASGIEVVGRWERPNSLGLFYGMMTQFCGFTRDSDEYKLMGLAPYGKANIDLQSILNISNSDYELNTDFIQSILPGQPQPTVQQAIYNEKLEQLLGPRRFEQQPMTEHYLNIAASAQKHLEVALVMLVKKAIRLTGQKKVCLSGGVALNCAANKVLMNLPEVEALYIQPAGGDAGISQGAAYLASLEKGIKPKAMPHTYWGTAFSNDELRIALNNTGVAFRVISDPAETAARLVANGKVIGWMQGAMEFGPRALGSRSILANPAAQDIKSLVNQKIKFRESFRPFCPSVLEEDAALYFQGKQAVAPYMTINYDCTAKAQKEIPGVVHVDQTARIQTVDSATHPLYRKYLEQLKEYTGHGVSLNTSFNVNRQPIVHNPYEAIGTFFSSGLDALVMGEFVVEKGGFY